MYAAKQMEPSNYTQAAPSSDYYVKSETARVPELPGAMERLMKTSAHVSELAERLDNRLTGVVARPEAPTPAGAPGAIKGGMCTGLGNELDSLNDRLSGVAERLQSTLDRLEF